MSFVEETSREQRHGLDEVWRGGWRVWLALTERGVLGWSLKKPWKIWKMWQGVIFFCWCYFFIFFGVGSWDTFGFWNLYWFLTRNRYYAWWSRGQVGTWLRKNFGDGEKHREVGEGETNLMKAGFKTLILVKKPTTWMILDGVFGEVRWIYGT